MTPHVAVLLHTPTEKPGSLAAFLARQQARVTMLPLYDGAPVPDDPCRFDLLVVMGGTMNVDETERYPFLAAERRLVRDAMAARVPVLGICLGAQMIARACDTPVIKSPQAEVGWYSVQLTPAAAHEPACAGLPAEMTVLQWHEDMALLPDGAVLLATSAACPHQAFRLGTALALQFHVEMTQELLEEWTAGKPELRHIAADFARHGERLQAYAAHIYERVWNDVCIHAREREVSR